jgi:large subunit ribosomal protein L25
METIEMQVGVRSASGKGGARALRREGRMPGIFYGRKRTPLPVTLDVKDFQKRVGALEGSHLLKLQSTEPEIDGRLALVKEIQRHPVTNSLLHADLYEVAMDMKLRIRVPLHFVGRAEGVEMGGILQPQRREVEVLCLPTDMPEFFEVDVTKLGLHDTIHISDLKPPAGVEIPYDSDVALVTVLPPVVEEVKVAEGEAAAAAPAEGAAAPTEEDKAAAGKGAAPGGKAPAGGGKGASQGGKS